jgi:hypothetical protein
MGPVRLGSGYNRNDLGKKLENPLERVELSVTSGVEHKIDGRKALISSSSCLRDSKQR